jgi:hypothetical protein
MWSTRSICILKKENYFCKRGIKISNMSTGKDTRNVSNYIYSYVAAILIERYV